MIRTLTCVTLGLSVAITAMLLAGCGPKTTPIETPSIFPGGTTTTTMKQSPAESAAVAREVKEGETAYQAAQKQANEERIAAEKKAQADRADAERLAKIVRENEIKYASAVKAGKRPVHAPTDAEVAATKKAGTRIVTIATVKGEIVAELYGKDAPLTVTNFINLAKANFYNGTVFHRVETDPKFWLIQGGDPKGDDPKLAGQGGPGYQIKLEIAPNLKHVAGALAMARGEDLDSAGSQFYICNDAVHQLDGSYAVFGKVIKGLDVAKQIVVGDRMLSVSVK